MQETVFITGGNRGIGLIFVEKYLAQGWRVYTTVRDQAAEQTLLSHLAKQQLTDEHLTIYQCDVRQQHVFEEMAHQLPAVDLLINNAAIYGPTGYQIEEVDKEKWLEVFAINTIAPLQIAAALLPCLKQGSLKKMCTVF